MSAVITSCIVIPCFNHGSLIGNVIAQLTPYNLHCIVVDDGSDCVTQEHLQRLCEEYPWVRTLRLPTNSGKGVAVIEGIKLAEKLGFSHVLQVDADGQHTLEDIPQLLQLAQQHPDSLISGQPIYDDSIPKARLYGRWITHIWVWIETLSFSLKDSMCGFRVYPIAPVLRVTSEVMLGRRMDFDTEIMVRLYWLGYDSHFIPTRVKYPENGISHFDALHDNLRISWMHSRLFFGMLQRLPSLLQRKKRHWAQSHEMRGTLGMQCVLLVWRLLGRRCCDLLLYPIIAGYWLVAHQARRASKEWLFQVKQQLTLSARPLPAPFTSYHHFLRFGRSMLDKLACWQGEMHLHQEIVFAEQSEACLTAHQGRGTLILASHLGNIEACRALAMRNNTQKIHAIVFHEHAQQFKKIMEKVAPDSSINLLPVTDMGPDTAMLIDEKLSQGDWVAIVGDRIAASQHRQQSMRVIWSSFLGRPAPFPQGPFILAAALGCPVITLFAIYQQEKLTLFADPFAEKIVLPRRERQAALQTTVDRYANRLEYYALLAPLEWFNFYDFWHLPTLSSQEASYDK